MAMLGISGMLGILGMLSMRILTHTYQTYKIQYAKKNTFTNTNIKNKKNIYRTERNEIEYNINNIKCMEYI